MISFYLQQDDHPPRRSTRLLRWLARWSWLPLLLLMLLGLGALGGWLAHDWYSDDGEAAVAAGECEPCQDAPAAAGMPAGSTLTPTPAALPTPTLPPGVVAAMLLQALPPTPTPQPTASPELNVNLPAATPTPLPTLPPAPAPTPSPTPTPAPALASASTPTPTPVLTPTPSPDAPPTPRIKAYWARQFSGRNIAQAEYQRLEKADFRRAADYYQWYVATELCSNRPGEDCQVYTGGEQRQPEGLWWHVLCEELEGVRACYRTSEWSVSYAGIWVGGSVTVTFHVRACLYEGVCSAYASDALTHRQLRPTPVPTPLPSPTLAAAPGPTLAAKQAPAPTPQPAPVVCNHSSRTQQVKDTLAAQFPNKEYDDITDDELATVDFLDLRGDRISTPITTLQTCDFVGLTGLEVLWLDENELKSLPERVFRRPVQPWPSGSD